MGFPVAEPLLPLPPWSRYCRGVRSCEPLRRCSRASAVGRGRLARRRRCDSVPGSGDGHGPIPVVFRGVE